MRLCVSGDEVVAPDPAVQRAWAADPEPFHAVVVLLHSRAVEQRMRCVARALHPWCRPGAAQAHVTLVACGPRPAVQVGQRCEVVVTGADSFTSASFLHAAGAGALRQELLSEVPEVDPGPFWVPHVTVGTYRWPMSAALVGRRLKRLRELPPIVVHGRVAVVRIDKDRGLIDEV